MENGTVQQSQYNNIEPFDVERLAALPHLELTTKGYEFVVPIAWIEMNHRDKPFHDKRFRQAIMYALDREFIRDRIWFGLGRVPTGPVNSVTKFYEPDVKRYDHDTDKAEALLDEMGLEPGDDGVRTTVKFLPIPYGETWIRLGEYIKQALGEVGIKVVLESTDAAGWAQRVANWNYEMTTDFVYQYGDPALGVARTYVSDNIRKGVLFSNTMGYKNPKVDELFEQAAKAIDPDKRQALYREVQRILVEDVPIAWLLEMEFPTLHDKRLHDATTTAIGVNETYDEAWLEKPQARRTRIEAAAGGLSLASYVDRSKEP